MDNIYYYNKYLKYKNKYLKYKNKYLKTGGSRPPIYDQFNTVIQQLEDYNTRLEQNELFVNAVDDSDMIGDNSNNLDKMKVLNEKLLTLQRNINNNNNNMINIVNQYYNYIPTPGNFPEVSFNRVITEINALPTRMNILLQTYNRKIEIYNKWKEEHKNTLLPNIPDYKLLLETYYTKKSAYDHINAIGKFKGTHFYDDVNEIISDIDLKNMNYLAELNYFDDSIPSTVGVHRMNSITYKDMIKYINDRHKLNISDRRMKIIKQLPEKKKFPF